MLSSRGNGTCESKTQAKWYIKLYLKKLKKAPPNFTNDLFEGISYTSQQ